MRKFYRFPRSYRNRNKVRKHVTKKDILFLALGCSLFYLLFSSFVINVVRIGNDGMAPVYGKGTMVVTVPVWYSEPERGDVVLYRPDYYRDAPWWLSAADAVVRFVTGQMISPEDMLGYDRGYVVKRIAGLPGERIRITSDRVYIAGTGEALITEHETIPTDSMLQRDIPETELGENEYYLISDNRNYISDSRSLGGVDAGRIKRKVIYSFNGK